MTPEEIAAQEAAALIAKQDLARRMVEQGAAADQLAASLTAVTEGTDRFAAKQKESLQATVEAKEAALEYARVNGSGVPEAQQQLKTLAARLALWAMTGRKVVLVCFSQKVALQA